ncbi:hypothetical protein K1719_032464 [Acacia pycnantha]|nr:hypothetical protein K1719_032464 [Acacia pycnantha]
MLKMEYGGGYTSNWVRLCDSCRSSTSTRYCHTDSEYLCSSCDGQIHALGSPGWPHHRVKLCGVCENAPVAFTCKADDASLCVNCDSEIHSSNPNASRLWRNRGGSPFTSELWFGSSPLVRSCGRLWRRAAGYNEGR